jgi:hypothetical protein
VIFVKAKRTDLNTIVGMDESPQSTEEVRAPRVSSVHGLRQALEAFQNHVDMETITELENRAADLANQIVRGEAQKGSRELLSRAFLSLRSQEVCELRLKSAGDEEFRKYRKVVASSVARISRMFRLPLSTTIETLPAELSLYSGETSDGVSARLERENAALRLEVEQLKSKMEERPSSETELFLCQRKLEGKEREVRNLMNALDLIASEVTREQQELSESDIRSQKLFQMVELQSAMIAQFESESAAARDLAENQEHKIAELSANADCTDRPTQHLSAIFEQLRAFVNGNVVESVRGDVLSVLDSEQPSAIVTAFGVLNQIAKTGVDRARFTAEREELCRYLDSQSRLFLSLSVGRAVDEDLSVFIREATHGIDRFLREQAPTFMEKETIFDVFGLSMTPMESISLTSDFVSQDQPPLDGQEFVALIRGAIAINALLKRIAEDLRSENGFLILESRKLQGAVHVLQNQLDDAEFGRSVADAELLEKQKVLQKNHRRLLLKYQKLKARNKRLVADAANRIGRVLEVLGDESLDGHAEDEQEKENETKELLKKALESARSKEELLDQQISSLKEELAQITAQCEGLLLSKRQLNNQVDLQLQANKRLRQKIQELTKQLEAAKDESRKNERHFQSSLQEKEAELEFRRESELKTIRGVLKSKLKEARHEVALQNQRAERAAESYAATIEDLQTKLRACQASEGNALDELKTARTEINALQTQMSENAVAKKLTELRMAALQERLKREHSLRENLQKAQDLRYENDVDVQVKAVLTESEAKMQLFLNEIAAQFRSFVQFDRPVTIESTKNLLRDVSSELRSLTKLRSEQNEIVGLLGTDAVIPAIQNLRGQAQSISCECPRAPANLKNDWDRWARRVLTSATGASAAGKADDAVRSQLEEAIVAGIGKTNELLWKLESLRAQKKFCLLDRDLITLPGPPLRSLRPVLDVLVWVKRAQRIAAHVHPHFTTPIESAVLQRGHGKPFPILQIV